MQVNRLITSQGIHWRPISGPNVHDLHSELSSIDVAIRNETPGDVASVYAVNRAAFEGTEEATLVDRLRGVASPLISLVAESGDNIVGHILFSPVKVEGISHGLCFGLGPMAVLPANQDAGIGTKLVHHGLASCRALGAEAVFVLGHPDYYPRFGFCLAAPLGLRYKSERFDPFFFVLEMRPGFVADASGLVCYHAAFDSV